MNHATGINGGKTMPLTSDINKKDMTEEDIKNRFVTPALNQAGWENLERS